MQISVHAQRVIQSNIFVNEQRLHAHVSRAHTARLAAYAPYSKYYVGCSVCMRITLGENEHFSRDASGCNVENSSYGLTICAERSAIVQAVHEIYSHPIANGKYPHPAPSYPVLDIVALATESSDFLSPCGACLQVIHEFATPDTLIVHSKNPNDLFDVKVWCFHECLPFARKVV